MSKFVQTGGRIVVGYVDISSDVSRMSLPFTAEYKDATNMASGGWKEGMSGLAEAQWEGDGFEDPGEIATYLHDLFTSGSAVPVMVTDSYDIPDGTRVWTGLASSYSRMAGGGQVGDISPDKFMFKVNSKPYRGVVLASGTLSATSDTAPLLVGAFSSTQTLNVIIHQLTGTGDFDVAIQSDIDAAFLTPTDRSTSINLVTPEAYMALGIAGPITDTYWRISFNRNSGGPLTYIATISIQ